MLYTWNSAATGPRDKIFALLDIVQRKSESTQIKVDYGMFISSLFITVGRHFVEAKNVPGFFRFAAYREPLESLEALSLVQFQSNCDGIDRESVCLVRLGEAAKHVQDLPSWEPNFHWPLNTTRLWDARFNAAGDSKFQIHMSEPEDLRLDGTNIDSAVDIHSKSEERRPGPGLQIDILSVFSLISRLDPIYPTGVSRVKALWHTLIAGETIDHATKKTDLAEESLKKFCQLWPRLMSLFVKPTLFHFRLSIRSCRNFKN